MPLFKRTDQATLNKQLAAFNTWAEEKADTIQEFFIAKSLEHKANGCKKCSMQTLAGGCRYLDFNDRYTPVPEGVTVIRTNERMEEYLLNNNYLAFLSRYIMLTVPPLRNYYIIRMYHDVKFSIKNGKLHGEIFEISDNDIASKLRIERNLNLKIRRSAGRQKGNDNNNKAT